MTDPLVVVSFPNVKREENNQNLIESSIEVADMIPQIDGFAVIAWGANEDGEQVSTALWDCGAIHPLLLSTLVKQILDNEMSKD